jgi:monoamine oxidase
MPNTRRNFIQQVGLVGGYGAAYSAMQAMGLLAPASAFAEGVPDLAAGGGGGGAKVVILGAGVAGMSAAYELRRAGYDCAILEARSRVGGRNWTLRRGDEIVMKDGSRQLCQFDEGQYFNAGPARLPSHHQIVLGYCRELGVELEVEVNTSRGALLLNPAVNGGKPIQLRRAVNDARGHVSELLAKAINQGALDQAMNPADKARMAAFLKVYGDLDAQMAYRGSERSGYKIVPGAGDQVGLANDPLPMNLLLDEDMWNGVLFEDNIEMQATMFQPKGGMDQFPKALAKALGAGVIKSNCEVQSIRKAGSGVTIGYRDRASGQDLTLNADYCISTIPLPVLSRIPADFSPAYAKVIASTPYRDAIKIAWQAPRFWEGPTYQIYGGISWVKAPNALVWYPSHGMNSKTGVLLGAYSTGQAATQMMTMTRADQIAFTRKVIDQLHPGCGQLLEHPLQVEWSNIPHTEGIGVAWAGDDDPGYALLGQPDGRIYFAGEYLSHVGAWQEGAIRSAHRAIAMLDAAHRQGRPVSAVRALG